jgi:hypothetical protein
MTRDAVRAVRAVILSIYSRAGIALWTRRRLSFCFERRRRRRPRLAITTTSSTALRPPG